ncbi:HK97 family phage prohead protease [Maliponia aquimaris]|uniref:Caudovirus prohead protease n=1 Tax=Maliponia aquimaris TaxID=1673631 RepID=A0A238KKA5_9RHOB|nr:HK97 family phage prohead protease [Maliponia aquimaris]SMX42542.1 Caudovirus prohead protease [Maliponia aquimaris]
MLFGGVAGGALELRRLSGGGARLRGRFPYNDPAELAPGRVEVIAPRAFAAALSSDANIYLLSGHDFDKPLASRAAGTLTLTDSDEALTFDATISDATSWARDFLAAHDAGLIRGLSPGFRVPGNGDRIDREGKTLRRTVFAAELVELSAVTRPAYDRAQVEARKWRERAPDFNRMMMHINDHYRWR